ncbi:MAG: molybdopterin cofactor-binding domain-containing protein [Sphingomicrobium sp.]
MSLTDRIGVNRRTLLIGGGVGVGLIVAIAVGPWGKRSTVDSEQVFGPYLKIGRDGRVVIAVPQVETGQGIWTALPQLAADELGAAWEMVAVEPAPFGDGFANAVAEQQDWFAGLGRLRRMQLDDSAFRITAGSTSVRAFEQPMRLAGAVARTMLIKAAAVRWNVDQSACDTLSGKVISGSKALGFGELAEEAATFSLSRTPVYRKSRGGLVGQSVPRLDLPAKSDGSFRFAGDVRLPNMLFASARLVPPGGKIVSYERSSAIIEGDGWVAGVGETAWAAEQALKAAGVRFDMPHSPIPLDAMIDDALATGDAERWFSRGDYAGAVEGSRALTALYRVAPTMHLVLEPATATARSSGDRVEVWAAAQAPGLARDLAKRSAEGASVTFYPMPTGEPGGRAMEPDAIPVAIALARRLRRPVQVSLTPSVSQNHDHLAPGAVARMYGLPGPEGITAAWKMRLVTASGLGSALSRLAGGTAQSAFPAPEDGGAPPYAIAHVQIDAVPVDLPFLAGYMRGSPEREIAFFTESFVDELARAAGLDPLVFRMAMLGSNPRLARCLQQAASASGWNGGGRGSTLGIAGCSAFGSHIALVAEATIGADQTVEVHRLVAAVDCGRLINPGLVRQQIESGMLWALGQATMAEPNFVGSMPVARALQSLGLPRMAKVPEVRVDIIANGHPPGGISGLGVAVLAPAVANAIYAGTGKRLRSLPFDPMAA